MRLERHDWVVVAYPGTDLELPVKSFPTFREAQRYQRAEEEFRVIDIMKRLPNGQFTTEY